MEKKYAEILNKCVTFANGVSVINTTPHELTFQDIDGQLVQVPVSGVLVNAKPVEVAVESPIQGVSFVETKWTQDEDSLNFLNWMKENHPQTLVIGSAIALQAYKGLVVGMTPVPGFERVAPADKRMSVTKFTV